LIAGLTHSLAKLSENTHDYYLTIGSISPEFQKQDSNSKNHVNKLYEEVIFTDIDFEMDRDRLLKDGEKSFLDFYSSRQQMKNSPVIDNFNSRGVIGNSESRNSQQGSFGRKSVSHHTAQA
jgi:hypothetical protein